MISNHSLLTSSGRGVRTARRAAGALALLACLVGPRPARGDGYVLTVVPAKDGQPGFLVGVKVNGVNVPFIISIDTGNGKPDNGGLIVNNNPAHNTAGDIGMTGGKPGTPIQTPAGPVTPIDDANMPAGQTVQPPPTTNPGNKTTQPTLPAKASETDLGGKDGADAIIGIRWLDDNFRSWGETQGKIGKFFFLTSKDQSADDAVTTYKLALNAAGDAPQQRPDGRPVGTDFKPLVFVPPQVLPSGALFINGGFSLTATLTDLSTGNSANNPFIISSRGWTAR